MLSLDSDQGKRTSPTKACDDYPQNGKALTLLTVSSFPLDRCGATASEDSRYQRAHCQSTLYLLPLTSSIG